MVFPWVAFLKESEEDLANFIDIPLFARSGNSSVRMDMIAHRLLKIEDSDTVVFLSQESIGGVTNKSLETRLAGTADYVFPNKTVKFFLVVESTGGACSYNVRTSATANAADGTTREAVTLQSNTSVYTTEVIEGNFSTDFLTIEKVTSSPTLIVMVAVIIEPV